MPTVDPIIIRGRLLRAQAAQTYGLSQLSLTLELPASTQGGAPTTVECLMATGRSAAAWKAAQHAEATAYPQMPCEVRGADLRLAGTQLWLLGVTHLRALPADALPPAVDAAAQLAGLLGPHVVMQQPTAQPPARAGGGMTAIDHTARLDVAVRPPLLIGLCGFAGAGVADVADYLEREYAFSPISMDEPTHNMIAALFADAGVGGGFFTEPALMKMPTTLGHSFLHLERTLRSAWGRTVLGPTTWLRVAGHKLDEATTRGDNAVITEIRHRNEATWLHERGGLLVRVNQREAMLTRWDDTEAEIPGLPADHALWNNGSAVTLHDQIDRLIDELRAAP